MTVELGGSAVSRDFPPFQVSSNQCNTRLSHEHNCDCDIDFTTSLEDAITGTVTNGVNLGTRGVAYRLRFTTYQLNVQHVMDAQFNIQFVNAPCLAQYSDHLTEAIDTTIP